MPDKASPILLNIDHSLHSKKVPQITPKRTLHSSSSWASYGMSFWQYFEEIWMRFDRTILYTKILAAGYFYVALAPVSLFYAYSPVQPS